MLCHITGTLYKPDGTAYAGAFVNITSVPTSIESAYLGAVVPRIITVRTDSNGNVDFNLLTGEYIVSTSNNRGLLGFANFTKFNVPELPEAQFSDCIDAATPVIIPAWLQQAIIARDESEAARDASEASASDAADSADTALDAAARAESAADAASVSADVFPSVAAGLAGTSVGDQFQVVVGDYIIRYRNDGATATEVASIRNGASLSNVDNTADIDKPLSNPQALAIDKSEAVSYYRASLDKFVGDLPVGAETPVIVDGENHVLVSADKGDDDSAISLYKQSLSSFVGDVALGDSPPLLIDGDNRVLVGPNVSGGGDSASSSIQVWSNSGQSNAVGSTDGPAQLVYPYANPQLLVLERGGIADQWTGLESGGGTSYVLDASSITSIGPMSVQLSTRGQGTTSAEAASRAAISQGVGPILLWSNAEGGQSIENLLPAPPAGYHSFANYVKMLTRAEDLRPDGVRLSHTWTFCQQGESNTSTANLGELHNQLRADYEVQAKTIFGQTEALRMVDWQPSSFGSASAGVLSILNEALSEVDGAKYFCGGATYMFPFIVDGYEADAAFLHNSSLGHAMRGEMGAAIVRRVESDGVYLPVHAVSATVTGANTVTVVMSEAVEVATDSVVAAVANQGITLTGGTVSAVSVAGTTIQITTTGAASDVTSVNFGLTGQTTPRTEARIPRTNIRAVKPLGTYSWGGLIRAWACHQSINIT